MRTVNTKLVSDVAFVVFVTIVTAVSGALLYTESLRDENVDKCVETCKPEILYACVQTHDWNPKILETWCVPNPTKR
jgi:hypothetical protein